MTGDDRLRTELRSLEEAAPANLPPRPSVAASRGWRRLAFPALVMVIAGTLIGLSVPAWLPGGLPFGARVGELVPVPTTPPAPSGQPALCHQALMAGTLVRDPVHGFAVAHGEDRTPVRWPNGYLGREGPEGLELLNEAGQVVAREGDYVEMGGGQGGEMWIACPGPDVVPPEFTGRLEGDEQLEDGCIWLRPDSGRRWPIAWPDGYQQEFRDGQPVLLRDGEVVAEAGDAITVRGAPGAFGYACIGFSSYVATEVVTINPDQPDGPSAPPSTTAAPEGKLVPVPTSPPNPTGICHLALIEGTLVRDPEHGFAILHGGDRRSGVEWPNGYVAREGPDGLELLDAERQVVGREGDGVLLGGSFIGELWRTCAPPDVVPTTLTGVLEGDPELEGGCMWLTGRDGRRWAVRWPGGYREELRGEEAVLLEGDEVVAREGDEVTVRGSLREGFSYCGTTYEAAEVLRVTPGEANSPTGGLTHVARRSMSFVLPPGWTYRLPEPVWGTERFIFFSNQPMHSDCERTEDEYGVLTRCGLPIDQLVSDGVLVEWWNIWLPTPPPPLPAGDPYAIGGREGVRASEDVSDCGQLGATHAERITLPGTSHLRICARDPSGETMAELDALLQSIEFWGDEVTIPTHEAPPASGSPLPCAASLISGTLVRDDTYGVVIDTGDQRVPVVWQYGYSAREGPDGILVLDEHGTVRATEGERVELGGGMDAADERFLTCNY